MPLVQRRLNLGPLDNNTYILACSETLHAAIIDVGFEADVVIAEVRRVGFEVTLLLNTHAHYDHVAGMRTVQEALGGSYALHPSDRPLLERLTEQGAVFGFPPATPPSDVHDLADGQRIVIGKHAIEVIHTPGHSPGHVCFREGGHLWGGDVLFAGSVGRTDLPGGSWPDLERSIRERLFTLPDDVHVYPGHGPATTIGRERLDNPFVGERARLV